ncbi:MAG: ribbon-helix-helix domain-containing protein [Acidimicrobiales bacterium]
MARTQTLVQLDPGMVALLDERAGMRGTSRSALIREAVEAYLRSDASAHVDAAIVEGYRRVPPGEPDSAVMAIALASIEEEPW